MLSNSLIQTTTLESTSIDCSFNRSKWHALSQTQKSMQILSRARESLDLKTGLLFDMDETKEISNAFATKEITKLKKMTDLDTEFSVIKDTTGNLFALFMGGSCQIGKGGSGTVRLAQNLQTGELCLVKRISGIRKEEELLRARAEGNILRSKNLLFGYQERAKSGANYNNAYLFMKIFPGWTIRQFKKLNEKNNDYCLNSFEEASILLSAFEKLQQLKEEGIYHADLHGGNILIDPLLGEVHFIDYELAQPDPNAEHHLEDIQECCQTLLQLIQTPALKDILNHLIEKQYVLADAIYKIRHFLDLIKLKRNNKRKMDDERLLMDDMTSCTPQTISKRQRQAPVQGSSRNMKAGQKQHKTTGVRKV